MKHKKLTILCYIILLLGCLLCPVSAVGSYGMLPIYGRDVVDGTYKITVESDSQDFQVQSAVLTVQDGLMTAELTLSGTDCIGLFLGTAEEASQAESADWIGTTETVHGSTVCTLPVDALDRAISCAYFSLEAEAWLDNALLFEASSLPADALLVELPDYALIESALENLQSDGKSESWITAPVEAVAVDLEDGEYAVSVDMTGGSGKATVTTPTLLTVRDGKAYARLQWSSANYDYMIVGTETYYNTSLPDVNSVFEIPIECWDQEMHVIADTTAMGTPYEIQYTLTFYKDSIAGKGTLPQEAARRVILVALVIILGGGILNHFVKKRRA